MLCGNVGFQTMVQYGPIYLNKALGYDTSKTGFSAALPYVLSAITKICAGPISDRLTFLTDRAKVLIFASASFVCV
jgi:hypothetical protein